MPLSHTIPPAGLIAVLLACSPAPAVDPPPIGPQDLAFWRLPATADSGQVRRLLGPPDSLTPGDDPSQADPTLFTWWYGDLQVVFGYGMTVLGEWVNGPSIHTERQVTVGDPSSRVIARYGKPTRAWNDSAGLLYVDPSPTADDRCLFFEIVESKVHRIYIGYLVD